MPAKFRRLWCACTIIDYLTGTKRAEPCRDYIEQVEREVGQHEIVVSMWAEVEVVKFDGAVDDEAERRIKEFFGRDYIVSSGPVILQGGSCVTITGEGESHDIPAA